MLVLTLSKNVPVIWCRSNAWLSIADASLLVANVAPLEDPLARHFGTHSGLPVARVSVLQDLGLN